MWVGVKVIYKINVQNSLGHLFRNSSIVFYCFMQLYDVPGAGKALPFANYLAKTCVMRPVRLRAFPPRPTHARRRRSGRSTSGCKIQAPRLVGKRGGTVDLDVS